MLWLLVCACPVSSSHQAVQLGSLYMLWEENAQEGWPERVCPAPPCQTVLQEGSRMVRCDDGAANSAFGAAAAAYLLVSLQSESTYHNAVPGCAHPCMEFAYAAGEQHACGAVVLVPSSLPKLPCACFARGEP